jgi:hypothetical protein
MIYEKTYGACRVANGRYAVVSEIEEHGGRSYRHVHTNLTYKSLAFTLQKAETFMRACHSNFTRDEECITFTFTNCGLLPDMGEGI